MAFRLLKDGNVDVVERELLASRICRCFDVAQILYEEDHFDGVKVTVSDNITSKAFSLAPMESFIILHERLSDSLHLPGYHRHEMPD